MNVVVGARRIFILRENMDVVPTFNNVQRGRAYFSLRAPVVGDSFLATSCSSSIPFNEIEPAPGHEGRPRAAESCGA